MFTSFFKLCAGFLLLLGRIFHCSYEKISVIFNLYIQGEILTLSGMLPLVASSSAMISEPSGWHFALCVVMFCYATLYIVMRYLLFKHYPPQWVPTFNLCVRDLQKLGKRLHISYVLLNLIILVVWWLAVIAVNVLLSYYIWKMG